MDGGTGEDVDGVTGEDEGRMRRGCGWWDRGG